jgi:nucleoside-diphosphate-sugar epimerase
MTRLALPEPIAARLRDSGRRVLVTGASGWLGQAALEMLAYSLGPRWSERVACFGSAARTLRLRDGLELTQRPLAEMASLPRQPSILMHFAYLTREKVAGMPPDDYVATNRAISRLTVEAAARVGVDRVFLTSSGAVYAAMAAPTSTDPSLLYGRLKREDEELFAHFAAQAADRRVMTARLFNLSGPYINKLGSYALASFIEQARRGSTIEIRAAHPVIRSYTSAENLLGVAFGGLLAEGGEPYLCFDTAGEREVEVQELADAVRDTINPEAMVQRASFSPAGADRYVGDGHVYHALAARHGVELHDLARQVADTAEYLNHVQQP